MEMWYGVEWGYCVELTGSEDEKLNGSDSDRDRDIAPQLTSSLFCFVLAVVKIDAPFSVQTKNMSLNNSCGLEWHEWLLLHGTELHDIRPRLHMIK
jgi:hypothetical protein